MIDKKEPKVSEILNFGQCDDDIALEITEAVHNMLYGYYTLVDFGDDWWKFLNRTTMDNDAIKGQWDSVNWDSFVEAMWVIDVIVKGGYIRSGKFVDALKKVKELGYGYRQTKEEKSDEL